MSLDLKRLSLRTIPQPGRYISMLIFHVPLNGCLTINKNQVSAVTMATAP